MLRRCLAAAVAVISVASTAAAQTSLTLERALQRAREAAVPITAARIAEMESLVADTLPRFHHNPVLEGHAGTRAAPGRTSVDMAIGIAQEFETGGQQQARRAIAEAAVERRTLDADAMARAVLVDVATLFLKGLAAAERVQVADAADTISRALRDASERRFTLGDISAIELNLARVDAARTASTLASLRAEVTTAVGALQTLLRLPPGERIRLEGTLDVTAPAALVQLESAIAMRPDLAARAAEVREAEAETQLGRGMARPNLGLRVAYEREADDHIVLGGLSLTLPVFQTGQSALAGGVARAGRARLDLEAARATALSELRSTYEAFEQRASAVAAAAAALPSLADNDNLAQRSYEAGEMNLTDLLLLRRNALEARQSLVALRLDAALERLRVDIIAGVLR